MHVCMKEAVTKHLGKENGDPIARQLRQIDTRRTQFAYLADRNTPHALHHQHLGLAIVPEHLGDQHQVKARHVAAQLGRISCFAHQVELVMEVFVEFGNHLARLEALAVGRQATHPSGHHAH